MAEHQTYVEAKPYADEDLEMIRCARIPPSDEDWDEMRSPDALYSEHQRRRLLATIEKLQAERGGRQEMNSVHLIGPVKVSWQDESGTGSDLAIVHVDDEDGSRLALVLHATIEHKKGADGGMYPCVVFRSSQPNVRYESSSPPTARTGG